MKVFLQDKEGNNHELKFDEFYRTVQNKDCKKYLEEFFKSIQDSGKLKEDDIITISIENVGDTIKEDYLCISKFFEYHSEKLAKYLCQGQLNPKYVRAKASPLIVDTMLLNLLKHNDDIIIKGFAFCTNPRAGELYVTTTCGTGGTAKLFDAMLDSVQEDKFEKKYKYIKLDSVENPNTIRFYTKLGFRKPDKDTEEIIRNMYQSKAKSFDEYVKTTKKIVGGPMYLFPINAEGEKMLKKKKCNHIYSPEEWFDELKKFKKAGKSVEEFLEQNKKDKLEGAGIGSWFRQKFEQVKNIFKPNLDKFNNVSTKTISDFGNSVIKELEIMRTPINQMFHKIFNLITFNKWDEIRKKYNYDKLFHLALVATVNVGGVDKKVLMEKNEVVNINTDIKVQSDTEIFKVPLQGKTIRISELLDRARNAVGDKTFFDYDAFSNNCQFFIRYLLQYSGLLTPQAEAFLFQDLKDVVKELPSYVSPVVKGVTTLGAIVSKLRGQGKYKDKDYKLHAVIFRKPYNLDTAKSKAKEFIEGKKDFYRETQSSYHFRNIPKQKFAKGSFRSKRIDPNITLIFGELK